MFHMTYEVELKFRVGSHVPVESKLLSLGAVRGTIIMQQDTYYSHPMRNFEITGEVLRMRVAGIVNLDDKCYLTYKGAVIDKQVKARREVEVDVSGGSQNLDKILGLLGFKQIGTVGKTRIPYHLHNQRIKSEIALDHVGGVGNFVEIEAIVEDSGRELARDEIIRVAELLDLSEIEPRSYIEMVLDAKAKRDV